MLLLWAIAGHSRIECTAANDPISSHLATDAAEVKKALDARKLTRIMLEQGLVIQRVGQYGRTPIHKDPLEAQIVAGTWTPPAAGQQVAIRPGENRKWEEAKAGPDGSIGHQGLAGGYAYFEVPSANERVMILEAAGHGMVYVNGEPRAGDPYQHGYVRLPVLLQKGVNHFLFHLARGQLRTSLVEPVAGVYVEAIDPTLPDLIRGQSGDYWGAAVVINATADFVSGLFLESQLAGEAPLQTPVPLMPPCSFRKSAFQIRGQPPPGADKVKLGVRVAAHGRLRTPPGPGVTFELAVRNAAQTHKRTFISDVDGSVQYYAIVPARALKPGEKPGLVLALHGAGVEASGQAACYESKQGLHVVAPTNRRPFGFDWEDWGRLDALEVLALVQKQFGTDPQRTYLTGHSMGGHGVWHLGVTYPDLFAAIGPSAGWISMWSYAGARRFNSEGSAASMLQRAVLASDTLSLSQNYRQHGIYILHGDQDDNVPVHQARTMRKHLADYHADFAYFEQPGAGHWWGNACVDWPPMFTYFHHHKIPAVSEVGRVAFATASPGVSSKCHWASVEAQLKPFELSSVALRWDRTARTFSGTTVNVARLALDVGHLEPGRPLLVELDGQKRLECPWPAGDKRLWLARTENVWRQIDRPSSNVKGPQRSGSFKDAFRHNVVFVYGTSGTGPENAWALAKARFDAETFWYRGNGSIELQSDREFMQSGRSGCNIVIYGHADSNAAWANLLADSPVQVRRGRIDVGARRLSGQELGCLFIRPRPGSAIHSIGVVSGSGPTGMRLTDRLPVFISGVGYPDCLVLGLDALSEGVSGVRGVGFFGNDWKVETGEFVWKD